FPAEMVAAAIARRQRDKPGYFPWKKDGQGTGLGDLEALCDRAPIELGDYVWIDADGNGTQDPGETAVDGVTVNLYDDAGVLIATTTTANGGRYYFTDADVAAGPTAASSIATQTDYTIRFDEPSDYAPGGPLEGLSLTTVDADDDQRDSDAAPNGAGFGEIAVTTGLAGANDHTFDAGFGEPSLNFRVGNLVWSDLDDDGVAEDGEPGIAGVLVQLLDDAGAVAAETVTDVDGKYEFTDLEPGDYQVRIPNSQTTADATLSALIDADALVGARSSGFGETGTTGLDPDGASGTDDEDNDQDANGNLRGGQDLTSGTFTLGDEAVEPTDETLRDDDATDDDPGSQPTTVDNDRSNLTVDFGIFRGVRIGNQVWLDDGNGTAANADNGVFDTGESGISGVTVELWSDVDGDGVFEPTGDDSTGLLQSDVTDTEGNYHFGGVAPGALLFVAVDDLPAALSNPRSSTPSAADPLAADNVDDGAPTAGYLSVTAQFTAPQPGAAPTGESDTNPTGDDSEADANTATGTYNDGDSDLRIDLGFVAEPALELGNQIWFDDDLDGIYDRATESPVPNGVVVNLWTDPDGNGIPNTLIDTAPRRAATVATSSRASSRAPTSSSSTPRTSRATVRSKDPCPPLAPVLRSIRTTTSTTTTTASSAPASRVSSPAPSRSRTTANRRTKATSRTPVRRIPSRICRSTSAWSHRWSWATASSSTPMRTATATARNRFRPASW
ncbi:MAG: SdrD B-like domain-containing protein, partial [Ilumatobacter sp.]